MSKIVFLNLAEGRSVELKIDGDSTWMDVADEFVYFLQGSGYQVTREDIADHFNGGRAIDNSTVDFYSFSELDDTADDFKININLGDMVGTYNGNK